MQKLILIILLASLSLAHAQDTLRIQSETAGSFELISFNTTPTTLFTKQKIILHQAVAML